jgi:hypothetical protein
MPTSSFYKFQQFPEDVHHGVHDFSVDTLKVALCAAANAPDAAADSVLTDLTTVALTYLSSDTLVIASEGQTAGVYKITITDKTLQASGGSVGPFRYVVVYNDSSTNKSLIAYHDYGSDITLASGESILLDFDNANGYFTAQ